MSAQRFPLGVRVPGRASPPPRSPESQLPTELHLGSGCMGRLDQVCIPLEGDFGAMLGENNVCVNVIVHQVLMQCAGYVLCTGSGGKNLRCGYHAPLSLQQKRCFSIAPDILASLHLSSGSLGMLHGRACKRKSDVNMYSFMHLQARILA